MSQITKLPEFGNVDGLLRNANGWNLETICHRFERLLDAERNNMVGKGYVGPQAKRLEFGEKVLDLLNLMYGWEKHNEENT